MVLWEDGKGGYLALDPTNLDAPVFAGTARKLHRCRTSSGSLNGGEGTGDRTFWEPRDGGRAAFRWTPQEATLSCGQAELPLKRVSPLEAKRLLSRADFLAPRWRRIPQVLARDDEGLYFYVDGARLPSGEAAEPPDFRLYVGKKGALARVELQDALRDSGGLVFLTAGGRLVVRQQGRKQTAEWGTGNTRIALTWLEPSDHGPLIYRELGVYAGQALGTPCDGRF